MTRARREAVLDWYDRTRRPLPWRATHDPYAVLVSEVMAQQTQVARVIPYYERFVELFPTVEALAAAPLAPVLAAWSGLGYNRRARYLRAAAAHVVENGWPTTAEGLRDLPGVGPYTAAAVASISYGEVVAAVDTNVRRVLSRWAGVALEGRALESEADRAIDPSRPGDWNQAIMDLGARVCTRLPACDRCPVTRWCADASVYVAPAKQPRFDGSPRQARGSVLRELVRVENATQSALAKRTGLDTGRLSDALESLESDGMVERTGRRWQLPAEITPGNS